MGVTSVPPSVFKGGSTARRWTTVTEEQIDPRDRALVEDLYRPLQRFAAVVAPQGVEGDDLLQEAMVRVLRTRRLHELEYPAAYLRTSIVNLASNQRRRAGARRTALSRWAASHRGEDHDAYPSDLAELMALEPGSRAVLYLAEVEGYPFEEIGTLIGCSAAAARKRASRARQRLRTTLIAEAR
jgi:RNA polymerase sigma-70 factor (ECF subfamily)